MDKIKINKWINENVQKLTEFDLNKNGELDEFEISSIYQTIVEYLKSVENQLWYYYDIEQHGPISFSELPTSKDIFICPNGSKYWLPRELFDIAILTNCRKEYFSNKIILSTTENIKGYEIIEYKGIVWGVSVRAKDCITDMLSGFKQFFGGEMEGYTQLAIESKQQALDRMCAAAQRKGATAVLKVHFDSGGAGYGSSEVTAYGTAVLAKKIEE